MLLELLELYHASMAHDYHFLDLADEASRMLRVTTELYL